MLETAVIAFATFFATIGPLDVAVVFASLTPIYTPRQRLRAAVRAVAIATGVLMVFVLFGEWLLKSFGITLAALRTAGGLLLFLIAIDLVFAHGSGGTSTTDKEEREAEIKKDVSVFPIATPLIAGPGTMSAAILLMANTEGDVALQAGVVLALLAVLLFTLASLIIAGRIQKVLGITGVQVTARIFGVLLAALAVQFVFDGIKLSGLLN